MFRPRCLFIPLVQISCVLASIRSRLRCCCPSVDYKHRSTMAAMNPNGGPNPSESYCIYNCSHSPSPLTTTFTPPTRCSDYWTPVLTLGVVSPTISFTQNVTRAGCAPSGWASCSHCGMTISPGICPSGWPVASVGIANGVTTSYCCPSFVPSLFLIGHAHDMIEVRQTILVTLIHPTHVVRVPSRIA